MKNVLTLLLYFFCITAIFSQYDEFQIQKNGLIYNDKTMSKLEHIVDSLNLMYSSCELDKTYYAQNQTVAHKVNLKHADIGSVKKDMKNNMPLEEFLEKYPNAKLKKEVLVIRYKYTNYKGREVVQLREIDPQNDYGVEIKISKHDRDFQKTWRYETYEGSITAFYFENEFSSIPLPEKYANMIGYADCLIDSTTLKFKEDAKQGWVNFPDNWSTLPLIEQQILLDKMRSTKVIGSCSMDDSPRVHAMNIAMLSAETTDWKIFLRSHLDIMNDRFDRVSDGSYAMQKRHTYIKELEELNINISDLIFGISLRIENPSENHYYGRINRIGRAFAETENRNQIEQTMLSMIEDVGLDDYNRVLSYFLFLNYSYHLEEEFKADAKQKLQMAITKLPNYLQNRLKQD